MRGLDPRIHLLTKMLLLSMDGRIKSGHDELKKPMPARLFLSSGDLLADRRYEFARDLQLKGDLPAAADLLEQAVELAPNFPSAWFTLGEIREQLNQHEAAITA